MPKYSEQSFRVFLSYASEDRGDAEKLCQRLVDDGIDVWMDTKKLLPGQDWKQEIAQAIESSHAVLVCLSNKSVSKEGYVQKELKDARKKAEEKPDGTIFLVPVRWDACKVPRGIADLQYVDLFESDGYRKLLMALIVRARSLGILIAAKEVAQEPRSGDNYELRNLIRNMLRDDDGLQESIQHLIQKEPDKNGWFHTKIRSELQKFMGEQDRPLKERARAGDILSMVGDPRFRPDVWFLPDDEFLGFVEIPAGPFQMGNSLVETRPGAHPASPQHVVDLPTYFINRYPVTVAQFNSFLLDTKSDKRMGVDAPGLDNHPVVSITWFEAMKYCQWLTDKLRSWKDAPIEIAGRLDKDTWVVTLPSEAEWEKAARGGTDAREFPWGAAADADRANYGAAGLRRTSAVGCFEAGISPYGLHDMSGNAWEWTRSNWGANLERPHHKYPYDPHDNREDMQSPESVLRVIRGGSCHSSLQDIRCDHRGAEYPGSRREHIGFRLAVSMPGHPGVKSVNER